MNTVIPKILSRGQVVVIVKTAIADEHTGERSRVIAYAEITPLVDLSTALA
jgi:hypothetical protein